MHIWTRLPLNSGSYANLDHEETIIEKKLQLCRIVYLYLCTSHTHLLPWPAAFWRYIHCGAKTAPPCNNFVKMFYSEIIIGTYILQ